MQGAAASAQQGELKGAAAQARSPSTIYGESGMRRKHLPALARAAAHIAFSLQEARAARRSAVLS